MPLPGNSSRTSTQAISVPNTALISTTITEAISVSLSEATAWSVVMALQKESTPLPIDFATTAASGISATMLRYDMATPRPRTSPETGNTLDTRPAGAAGGGAATASLAGGSALPLGLEDLGDHALLRVEEGVVHLTPATELGDLEELRRRREALAGLGALHYRAVALVREDLLRLRGVEEVNEGLGFLGLLGLVVDRDRVLDQDGLVGDDVVHVLALLLGQDRLVLVADQHVALAARECLERLTCALVEHRHVVEQLGEVVLGLVLRLALLERGAVGGHDVPLRATRRERVGHEHLDVVLDQVVPGLDVLGVALADHQDHD